MKRSPVRVLSLAAAAALLFSCAGLHYRYASDRDTAALLSGVKPSYPPARFAVVSDAHLYDSSLGTEGAAFTEYVAGDRKLLKESEEILEKAMEMVRDSDVSFLLLPGDLTKDGERQSHLLLARHLADLAQSGVKIYVIPGNHDILNPHANRFTPQGSERVPTVAPEEFAEIYKDFGYGQAVSRDAASLSYVAEPVPGLWLLALDDCKYRDNLGRGTPEVGGKLGQETVSWIEGVLADALRKDKAVIAMMHHGILEHYTGQKKYFPEYVVDDYRDLSAMFAAYGVRVFFTGHYHAQDITKGSWDDGGFLYDVETGSLVSSPNPVRVIEIGSNREMRIESRLVTEIPSFVRQGRDFAAYSRDFSRSSISGIALKTMVGMGVPEAEARTLTPQISDAFIAHYAGDEKFAGTEMLRTTGLSLMGVLVVANRKDLVEELWHDLEPPDNDVTIDLSSGAWRE
jgi:3',5'-cyclic AMP phosphodiesterase CpdA